MEEVNSDFDKIPKFEIIEPVSSCKECFGEGTSDCSASPVDDQLYCTCNAYSWVRHLQLNRVALTSIQFQGTTCDFDYDQCETVPCGLHGKCSDKVIGYDCMCDAGWDGEHCQIDRANVSMSDPKQAAELRAQTMGCVPVIIILSIAAIIALIHILTKKNKVYYILIFYKLNYYVK